MSKRTKRSVPVQAPPDLNEVLGFLLSKLFLVGVDMMREEADRYAARRAGREESQRSEPHEEPRREARRTRTEPRTPREVEAMRAAELLGVPLDATEDVIRAALRARLATSRLHPDHGGDGVAATELIAAKNLLVERARSVSR
jgi:hypothetical protein